MDNVLPRQLTRSSLGADPLALIMPDVDRFKRFNNEFGHLAGDQALYAVSQILVNNVHPTDLVARYGGEEFVVVLPDTDLNGARQVAERIREALSEAVIMMSDGSVLPSVTVLSGISETGNKATAAGLLADADAALYRASRQAVTAPPNDRRRGYSTKA